LYCTYTACTTSLNKQFMHCWEICHCMLIIWR
jgi:hypothetical protein